MAFTVREVAEHLLVSTATVYGWVKSGRLEHLRLGGNVIRIPAVAMQRFLGASESSRRACCKTIMKPLLR